MSSRSRPVKLGWFRAVARYYRDPSASLLGKLVALVAFIYVIVPVDLIPDVPIVGWLDDLGVVGLAMAWLTRRIATYREPAILPQSASGLPVAEDSTRRARPFSVSP